MDRATGLIQLVASYRSSEIFHDIVFTCVDESKPISVNKFDQRLNETLVFQAAVSNRRSRPVSRHRKARAGPGFPVLNLVVALVSKKPDDSLNRRFSPSFFYSQ